MTFPNPVRGVIQAKAEKWKGTPVFRQVRTAADHAATGQGFANDFGNGRGNADPVLAVGAGSVITVDPVQGIVVVQSSSWRWGYAHMRQIRVARGNAVAVGQQLGLVSDAHDPSVTNFSGPHLHFAIWRKTADRPDGSFIWEPQDPWPLLSQNAASGGEMDTVQRIYPARRDCSTKGGALTGYRLNPPPLTKAGTFAAGSGFHSDSEFTITPTPAGWPAGPYQRVVDGFYQGYLVANAQINLGPEPVAGAGNSQAELDAAYNAGRQAVLAAAATVPPK